MLYVDHAYFKHTNIHIHIHIHLCTYLPTDQYLVTHQKHKTNDLQILFLNHPIDNQITMNDKWTFALSHCLLYDIHIFVYICIYHIYSIHEFRYIYTHIYIYLYVLCVYIVYIDQITMYSY